MEKVISGIIDALNERAEIHIVFRCTCGKVLQAYFFDSEQGDTNYCSHCGREWRIERPRIEVDKHE